MSSKSVGIIAPDQATAGATEAQAWVDGTTNALLVKVVNPGGGGGGGTEFFEDTPHISGDAGNMPLAVRKDAAGSLVSTDGDYAPLQVDASGALRVVVVSGGGGGGGTEFAEDSPHASGALGTLALAVRNDTPGALAGTDLDYSVLQTDATGRLRVAVDASVALSVAVSNFPATQAVTQSTSPWVIGDGGGSITVDGTVTAVQGTSPWVIDGTVSITALTPGTGAASLGKAEDDIHASGDVGVMSLAVRADTAAATAANGDYHPLLTDSVGRLHVNVGVVTPGSGVSNLGKAAGVSYTFGAEVGVAMMTIDSGTLTWQPVLSTGNVLQVGGTVVVSAVTPGTGATALGKAEDAVHASGDTGVMMLAVRNDASSALAANGDYIPLTTNSVGSLFVTITGNPFVSVSTVTPGTGSTDLGKESLQPFAGGDVGVMFLGVRESDGVYLPFIQQDQGYMCVEIATVRTGASGLAKTEDSAHSSGDIGVPALVVRQDTLASSTSTDGDYANLKVDSLGALYVNMGNPTSLADGQLASSLGVLFTSSGRTRVESIDIFNTSSTLTETVQLNLQQNGGTSRQVRQYTLGPKESISVIEGDCWNLENGDEIEGLTTTATTVNYFITGIVR